MKKIIATLSVALLACSAMANVYVSTDKDGNAEGIMRVYGKNAKVNSDKNQYTDAEWVAFGITNEPPYIIKDGAVWRDMTQQEIDVVDAGIKQERLDEANSDVDMDALFNALATLLNKPRADVEAAFKSGVDPKKKKSKKDK